MPELLAVPLRESALSRANPFPGLRPYGEEDAEWFFGRSREINDLLKRLRRLHFVAIIGASGCGKSSLVRAGMVPQIRDGYLDAEWRIAQFRPGERPMANLAETLGMELGIEPGEFTDRLRRSPMGLVRAIEAAELPRGTKVLILVDQFEELFQFAQRTGDSAQEEIKEFLKLLLTAANSDDVAVYVLVTMRLEWLSECSSYAGLAEAINEGLYLVPQMRRQQFQQAILGPLESADGGMTAALLGRMLNDLDGKTDQLPVLQHALLRLWEREGAREPFNMAGYEAVGTFSNCLSAHAEEVYAELTDRQKHVTELLFRSITQVNKGRKMRRPRPVADILEATKSTFGELDAVILAFSRPGRSFLVTTEGVLTQASIVDLSHEALIRQWTRLSGWVEHEAEVETRLARLREDAIDWDRDRAHQKDCLYSGSRLFRAAELQPMLAPGSTEAVFLKESIRARSLQKTIRWGATGLLIVFVVSALVFYAYNQAKARSASERAKLKQSQLETALAAEQARKSQEFQQNLVAQIDAAKGDPTALADIAQTIQAQRVYLQYGTGRAAVAATLQAQLEKGSYVVPGVQPIASGQAPAQTLVRYFHDEDRASALKIAGLVKSLIHGSVNVQPTPNPKDVVPAGQFEVAMAEAPPLPPPPGPAGINTGPVPPSPKPADNPVVTPSPAPQIVIPGPTIRMSNYPDPVTQGHPTTLTWQVEKANHVELEGVGSVALSGTMQLTPQQTKVYVMTARGDAGAMTTQLYTVTVLPTVGSAPAPVNGGIAEVKAALTRYKDAYESESLDDMKKAWPSIPKNQQKNLKTAFNQFNAIRLNLNCKDEDIHVQGDTASAACGQSAIYTIQGQKQPEQTSPATFRLRKAGGGWVVDAVQ